MIWPDFGAFWLTLNEMVDFECTITDFSYWSDTADVNLFNYNLTCASSRDAVQATVDPQILYAYPKHARFDDPVTLRVKF